MSDELLVKDLGEHRLLERLQGFCPPDIVGDDGAILAIAPHQSVVVTTDVLVDGVHFSDRTTSPFDVGWRAVAANLSDLAAMGSSPLGITVGLSLPGTKSVVWVEEVYRGMSACLQTYQTHLVGGDICRSKVTSLAITAMGEVLPHNAICRHHARVGDLVIVTGLHGLSRGGLEILLNPEQGKMLTAEERDRLIEAHQRPKPRLDVLPHLKDIAEQTQIAGMDSSDGLADAVRQICQRSGVGAIIDLAQVSVFSGLVKLVGEDALAWVLHGGEDFELVLCLPEPEAIALLAKLDCNAVVVGKITAEKKILAIDSRNPMVKQDLASREGFAHF